ncbi:beta-N-acetylhexosaminidase, partial [bacterium]|nr:beta-N-acetylhexosaminidase [bacterium]
RRAAGRRGLSRRLEYPALVAAAIARKVNLRRDLAAAYRAGDRTRLRALLNRDLPGLERAVRALWRCHRAMWMATYKPFGWEVIEGRYGGLLARLATVRDRLAAYLAGRIDSIPELEARLVDPWKGIIKDAAVGVGYQQVATPSSIK